MCGILGFIHKDNINFPINEFSDALRSLDLRGPDNLGISEQVLGNKVLKLGHTRLSILDLESTGNQPMTSNSGNLQIVFNGEIYNHLELRQLISSKKTVSWKGTSDTETLLELFETYKPEEVLERIEGMFSFCLFNKTKRTILLVRDHSGEKPLYFAISDLGFSFASDLNPLKIFPGFEKTINKEAVNKYLELNYIPSPLSIFNSSFKLPAGSVLEIKIDDFNFKKFSNFDEFINTKGISFNRWWTLDNFLEDKISSQDNKKDIQFYKKELKRILTNSIKSQLISDVPLGAFLSGGIDSSLVVSLMQEIGHNNQTFTVGFDFDAFDESVHAEQVANHLGTKHTTFRCQEQDVLELIPDLPSTFSEPFADSSQLPTMMVSKLARQNVTVALSGDGGDELFGGYNRYILSSKNWRYFELLPLSFIDFLSNRKGYFSSNLTHFILSLTPLIKNLSGDKQSRVEKVLKKLKNFRDKEGYYNSMVREWSQDDQISLIPYMNKEKKDDILFSKDSFLSFEEAMMHRDFETYLPDDILCKVDRSSMHYSLETRAPFLNKALIRFAYLLPPEMKIYKGNSKFILKELLKDYVPIELFERPKQGFGLPISEWMRSSLKDWTNDMLSEDLLDSHGFFNKNLVSQYKQEHFSGIANHEHKLWSIVQFNQWYKENV